MSGASRMASVLFFFGRLENYSHLNQEKSMDQDHPPIQVQQQRADSHACRRLAMRFGGLDVGSLRAARVPNIMRCTPSLISDVYTVRACCTHSLTDCFSQLVGLIGGWNNRLSPAVQRNLASLPLLQWPISLATCIGDRFGFNGAKWQYTAIDQLVGGEQNTDVERKTKAVPLGGRIKICCSQFNALFPLFLLLGEKKEMWTIEYLLSLQACMYSGSRSILHGNYLA